MTEGGRGFTGRFYSHRSLLRKNQHHAIYLQRSYNKYGEENFVFQILEFCDKNDDLLLREHFWMQKLNSIREGYNFVEYRESDNSVKMIIPSSTKKPFKFSLADGSIIEGNNLSEFCRVNNLKFSQMRKVRSGEIFSHQGYFAIKSNYKYKIKTIYRFLSIDDEVTYADNITNFCEQYELSRDSFHQMLSGKSAHCKGWHLELLTPKQQRILDVYKSDIKRGVNILNKNGDQFGRKIAFVQQVDQFTGEVLHVSDTIRDAIDFLFPSLSLEEREQKSQRVRWALSLEEKGIYKTAYKYVWRQGKDINDFEPIDVSNYKKNLRGPLSFEKN